MSVINWLDTPLATGYDLDNQPEWHTLLRFLDLQEGFGLVVVLTPEGIGSEVCQEALAQVFRKRHATELHSIRYSNPAALENIVNDIVDWSERAAGLPLWLSVDVASFEDRERWESAWTSGLARINENRDPLWFRLNAPLFLSGPNWLPEVFRRAAPDLWRIRSHVFKIALDRLPEESFPEDSILSTSIIEPHTAGSELRVEGERLEQAGNTEQAMRLYEQSLVLTEQRGDIAARTATLHKIAGLLAQQGNLTEAMRLYNQSLHFSGQSGNLQAQGATLDAMASLVALQGNTPEAMRLYQESLKVKEQIGDVPGKAATLHNLGNLVAAQGDFAEAMRLYQESSKLTEQIGDVRGKSAILHQMADVTARQGNIAEAIRLYEQSEQIDERIGDVRGRATTLSNLGSLAYQTGDIEKATERTLEAARILASARAYIALATALGNLSVYDSAHSLAYLAQSFWLCVFVQIPPRSAIGVSHHLVRAIGAERDEALPVAATILWLTMTRGKALPEFAVLEKEAHYPLWKCAEMRGIDPERITEWYVAEGLDDPNVFIPKLIDVLRECIGDTWVFDPADLPDTFGGD